MWPEECTKNTGSLGNLTFDQRRRIDKGNHAVKNSLLYEQSLLLGDHVLLIRLESLKIPRFLALSGLLIIGQRNRTI